MVTSIFPLSYSIPTSEVQLPETRAIEPTEGYAPRIGLYIAQLDDVRCSTLRYVRDMTTEELSWTPQADIESIGTLLLHVAAVERSWIGEDIARRPMGKEWMAAFPIRFGLEQITDKPLSFYVDKLEGVRNESYATLRALSDADLDRAITPLDPGDPGETLTIEWILYHLIEHEAHHRGQIAMMKRLFRQMRQTRESR